MRLDRRATLETPARQEVQVDRSELELAGQVAVVTGAGRGIGRAAALALAARGARVVVNDLGSALDGGRTTDSPADEVASEIQSRGGEAIAQRDSVADWPSAQRIIESALDTFGRLDLLVSCAGLSAGTSIWEVEPDVFDAVVRSHLHGSFHCLRAAAPHLKAQRSGCVVQLVSRAGLIGLPATAAYAAAKGGVFGLTLAASRDLAPFGVRVNAVNPAATETRMVTTAIEAFAAAGNDDPAHAARAAGLKAALQTPERVGAFITALCREDAQHHTGQVFYIDRDAIGLFPALAETQRTNCAGAETVSDLARALAQIEPASAEIPYENGDTNS